MCLPRLRAPPESQGTGSLDYCNRSKNEPYQYVPLPAEKRNDLGYIYMDKIRFRSVFHEESESAMYKFHRPIFLSEKVQNSKTKQIEDLYIAEYDHITSKSEVCMFSLVIYVYYQLSFFSLLYCKSWADQLIY